MAVRGEGHALGVVAGGGGHDGAALAPLYEGAYLVCRAPYFEGAGLLPVLALHPDLAARHGGESGAVVELRLVYDALEPPRGPLKVPE